MVATPPGLTSDCFGTETADAGASSASLSGGTVPALASCTTTMSVTGTTVGVKNGVHATGSTSAVTGNRSNVASMARQPTTSITKALPLQIELN